VTNGGAIVLPLLMQLFAIFLPHVLGVAGALLILGRGWRLAPRSLLAILVLYAGLFLVAVGLTPDSWLRARPTPDLKPTTAVILGFGYELVSDEMVADEMLPGPANQFLLNWVLTQQPQIRTLLVQEGVHVAIAPVQLQEKAVYRIHRHDPAIYIDTLDAAYCALHQLQQLGQTNVLIVTHDLQLQRAAWDFERVRRHLCPICTLVIPDLPATPYPIHSVHLQTRSAFVYKIIELLYLRPRDLLRPIPTQCKAPVDSRNQSRS